jgi:hypothetical protein
VTATLLIACGSLAQDVLALRDRHGWNADIHCAPALLHLRPDRIAPAVEKLIAEKRPQYARVIVVYGDCGTVGQLDSALDRLGVERVSGPHCFEQLGGARHDAIIAQQPGTFFLTDFLVRHFEAFVWKGLGLDRFPQLRDEYFGNYTQCVYLAQSDDSALQAEAHRAAQRLGLPLTADFVGYGALETRLVTIMSA